MPHTTQESLSSSSTSTSTLRHKTSAAALKVNYWMRSVTRRHPRRHVLDEVHHRANPLRDLPIETWVLILDFATAFSPEADGPVTSFLTSQTSMRMGYLASMRTKLACSAVNTIFCAITREFLYSNVWISKSSSAKALAQTLLVEHTATMSRFGERANNSATSGRYIRRLHIETPSMERAAPEDVRTILDHAPHLETYSDYRSVRRRSAGQILDLTALVHPTNALRRVSWTNYADAECHLHLTPLLTAAHLEYLELSYCSPPEMQRPSERAYTPPLGALGKTDLSLPRLQALKLTLDNATFAVLATWSLPQLQHLSVVSSDFSYAGTGFAAFFEKHGEQIIQLELGHSSSSIEEHYLTSTAPTAQAIPLADWCPNLKEFICSADAEWNWQTPDWIAPHAFLPSHHQLETIGIRDIDKRLSEVSTASSTLDEDDTPFFPLVEQIGTLLHQGAFPSLRHIRDLSPESHRMRTSNYAPPRPVASPPSSLKIKGKALFGVYPRHEIIEEEDEEEEEPEVLRPLPRTIKFWSSILRLCQERGVWLEDYTGMNVTPRDLLRASKGLVVSSL